MAQLLSDKFLHEWHKQQPPQPDPQPETLKLPLLGEVLTVSDGATVYVAPNDRGGFACQCFRRDGLWHLCPSPTSGALRAIISEKDVLKFKENPTLEFSKAKVIGHAKNGRAVFVSVILPDPQTE